MLWYCRVGPQLNAMWLLPFLVVLRPSIIMPVSQKAGGSGSNVATTSAGPRALRCPRSCRGEEAHDGPQSPAYVSVTAGRAAIPPVLLIELVPSRLRGTFNVPRPALH